MYKDSFGTNPKFMHRSDDPETSKEAAEGVDSTKLEQLVLKAIKDKGNNGATCFEIGEILPQHGVQTITPRVAPLLRKGYIYRNGDKRKGTRMQLVLRVNRRKYSQHVKVERRKHKECTVPANVQITKLKSDLKTLENLFLYLYENGCDTPEIEEQVKSIVSNITKRQSDVDF